MMRDACRHKQVCLKAMRIMRVMRDDGQHKPVCLKAMRVMRDEGQHKHVCLKAMMMRMRNEGQHKLVSEGDEDAEDDEGDDRMRVGTNQSV